MAGLVRHEPRDLERAERFDFVDRLDRMLDEWMRIFPLRRSSFPATGWTAAEHIKVDEFHDDGTLVVRAELPGIDPETDVEVTVAGGMLRIEAELREEERTEEEGYLRHELRTGSFSRTLAIPDGVTYADITATYKDGILEVRIPVPEATPSMKVPITKA